MSEPDSQFDFDNCSDAELRQWLISKGPIVEQFVIVAKRFCGTDEYTSEQLPCDTCKQRLDCKTSCDKLEAILPSPQKGKGRHENLTGLYPNTLQGRKIIRRKDILKQYESWKDDFTETQWLAIEMYYGECRTEKEIAQKTGKARSTVNGLLNRAKKIKEVRNKQLRWETRAQIKKMEESDGI